MGTLDLSDCNGCKGTSGKFTISVKVSCGPSGEGPTLVFWSTDDECVIACDVICVTANVIELVVMMLQSRQDAERMQDSAKRSSQRICSSPLVFDQPQELSCVQSCNLPQTSSLVYQ